MNNYIREPINGLTHLVGAILSLIALVAMVFKVVMEKLHIDWINICNYFWSKYAITLRNISYLSYDYFIRSCH